MPVPSREVSSRSNPRQIFEFGDKIAAKLEKDNKEQIEGRERSGKISGGKLGKPTLWAVLDLLGVPDEEFNSYLLGKFLRGHDVEDRAIKFLTDIDPHDVEEGVEVDGVEGAILQGKFILQAKSGYRGGTGYVDLAQVIDKGSIYHEVKSSTKMAYDKVAGTGRSSKSDPAPYYHHELQLAYYCLGDDVAQGFLHYFNADDYRLCSFAINPNDYKEEIDKEIDDIEACFALKKLPPFEAFLPYHKIKAYWAYKEWNELTPDEMMHKLKSEYPESYEKLMKGKL